MTIWSLINSYEFHTDREKPNVQSICTGGETGALTEEDPEIIYAELVTVYAQSPFDVLFCDETASQSGRILPLDVVTRFCQENSVCLVVDGTQSCQLFFRRDKKELFDQVRVRYLHSTQNVLLIKFRSSRFFCS